MSSRIATPRRGIPRKRWVTGERPYLVERALALSGWRSASAAPEDGASQRRVRIVADAISDFLHIAIEDSVGAPSHERPSGRNS